MFSIYFYFVLVYLFIMVGIVIYKSKAVKGSDDFSVAGRNLPAYILVTTLLATWIGSGTLIAGAEFSYKQGIAGIWMPAGAWLGIFIMYFIAKKVRRFEMYTAPDILGVRYSTLARVLGTLVIVIAYTAIVAYQFRAGGIVLNLVAGVSYDNGILITAIFVILYTAFAGMISIAYTDILNGSLILIASVAALVLLIADGGGASIIIDKIISIDPSKITLTGHLTFIEILGYFIPTFILLLGEASMYQKFFSAKSEKHAKYATVGWIVGTIIVETVFVLIAIIASSIYSLDELGGRPEGIILYVARYGLPVIFGSLLLAGAVAVIISTADSFLLTPATSFVKDIYQKFFRKSASEKEILIISRITVVILGIIAFVQIRFYKSVLAMAIYAYTMYGVSLTPALIAALLWKRATSLGGTLSIVVGMVSTLSFEIYNVITGDKLFGLPTVIPALILSVLTLIIFSYLSPKPSIERYGPFFTDIN